MKRSKIILGILILSVMALVLSGCGEGNLVTPPPLEENDTYALGDTGPAIQWQDGTCKLTGTGTAIGTGQANTTAIVTIQGTGNYAAQLCNDLTEGGYDDWFLPSKDELNLMYTNLYLLGVGGFAADWYWSSSEANVASAWYQYFYDGGQSYYDEYYYFRVRAVRVLRSTTYLVNYNACDGA
jgi:hypothetical protein